MKIFVGTMMAWLVISGLLALDGILKLFSLPSDLAVMGGIFVLGVLTAGEYYGFRGAVRLLRKKGN